ncbi:hypothetical protein HAX54_001873 [Datura stramonium]|uniref:Uncharacterized protein n=1 Tax=Datura stramonium TaxID=4076 RepID=A0ABS8WT26_DATST|nr:hypothetical protein [Datura stramonium]
MEWYGEKKKRSFSYDIGDEKLKLIDISSEDDFLIDSPLFDSLEDLRLSVTFDNINENGESSNLSRTSAKREKSIQVNQQKEVKHLSDAPIQPGRPSYLRKSSAWDNAFFTSVGLLDPHELSSINKEFDTFEEHFLEDVRARRPVLQSISDTGTGSRDMIDRGPVSKRKNMKNSRAERSKREQPCKRREYNSLDLKLPKRNGAGRYLMVSNSITHSSITSCPLYETSAYARKRGEITGKTKLSASVSSTKTPITSSTKSKMFENLSSSMQIHHSSHKAPPCTTNAWSLESSSSTSSTNRAHSDSNHRLNMTFGPTRNLWSPSQLTGVVASQPSGLCMPSPKFGFFDEMVSCFGFALASSIDMSVVRTFDGNSNQPQKQGMSASIDKGKSAEASGTKVKRARSPLCTDSVSRDSTKTRLMPSPRINPRYAASIHKAKTASYRASDARKDGFDVQSKFQTDKSIEIDRKVCSKLRKVGVGEHDRKKVGQNSSLKGDERLVNMILKTKMATTTDTPQSQTSWGQLYESSPSMSLHLTPSRGKGITSTSKSRNQENEVNDLSRYLELIDLNDGTETQLKQRRGFYHMRTPLVEKKSVCNTSVIAHVRSDMVKDKESSLISSKGTDKENKLSTMYANH